jgi:hypothetical protein
METQPPVRPELNANQYFARKYNKNQYFTAIAMPNPRKINTLAPNGGGGGPDKIAPNCNYPLPTLVS